MQELTYHWEGDYLIPDLDPPEAPRIGKYGTMRHKYLRDHHRGIFDGMLMEGSLNAHLEEIDRQANEMMENLTTQMAEREGVTVCVKCLLARYLLTKNECSKCSCQDFALCMCTTKLTARQRCLRDGRSDQKLLPEPRSMLRHSSLK